MEPISFCKDFVNNQLTLIGEKKLPTDLTSAETSKVCFTLKVLIWEFSWNIHKPNCHQMYAIFYKNQCLSPALGIRLHINFISITRNVDLADILHPEASVTQNDFESWISLSQVKTFFLLLGFQKCMVSNCCNKIH